MKPFGILQIIDTDKVDIRLGQEDVRRDLVVAVIDGHFLLYAVGRDGNIQCEIGYLAGIIDIIAAVRLHRKTVVGHAAVRTYDKHILVIGIDEGACGIFGIGLFCFLFGCKVDGIVGDLVVACGVLISVHAHSLPFNVVDKGQIGTVDRKSGVIGRTVFGNAQSKVARDRTCTAQRRDEFCRVGFEIDLQREIFGKGGKFAAEIAKVCLGNEDIFRLIRSDEAKHFILHRGGRIAFDRKL